MPAPAAAAALDLLADAVRRGGAVRLGEAVPYCTASRSCAPAGRAAKTRRRPS